ncbi:hypothetical protein JCM11251_005559 [Rhodosporidiobolus azoricus]
MGKKKPTAAEEKAKGNDLFEQGDFAGAVERYTKAIEKSEGDGKGGAGREAERAVYYLNRAQGWLKLSKFASAEADCSSAVALTTSTSASSSSSSSAELKPSSKAYWRRASARKELSSSLAGEAEEGASGWRIKARGAIDDYRKWHALATQEKSADAQSVRIMQEEVEALERKLKQGSTSALLPARNSPSPSVSSGRSPSSSTASSASRGSRREKLNSIHSSHSTLASLWADPVKRGRIITTWAEMAIQDVRKQKVKEAFQGVVDLRTRDGQREYPELILATLSQHSNLLDLISCRALRNPPAFAFHLDHVRAQTVLKSRQPPPLPRSPLYGFGLRARPPPAPAPKPLHEFMQILELPDGPAYGEVVSFNAGNSQKQLDAKKMLEAGEACTMEEGNLMLERQRVLYLGALRAAQSLLSMNDEDDEVDEDAVEEYESRVKARDYAGREEFRLERVEQTVKGFLGYAEDHLDFLRNDSEYVADYVLDRISPSAVPGSPVQRLLVKEEALQLFLNGFARQTLWKEALSLLHHLRQNFPPTLGTSPSFPLPPVYARKIGLVAKLVDAFVDLAFRELTQSVEHSFEEDLRKIGRVEGDDDFFAFLDTVAQLNGLSARTPSSSASTRRDQINPVARMFKSLCAIDPCRYPEKTWEVVAYLNELKTLFDSHPEQKSKLSRRLGEYAEAIELREMLIDSHLPRFNQDWADKSTFLTRVQPLWISMERCWVRSVNNDMAGHFIAQKDDAALQALWTAFDKQCVKDCKALPEQLFDDLLSEKLPERVVAGLAADEEEDEDDGPPPLVEISESEPEDENDGPPPLVQLSDDDDDYLYDFESDEDDYSDDEDDFPRQRAPRPALIEAQPGPSSGATPSARRTAPTVDDAALPDLHELEIRQREMERAEAAGAESTAQRRREKVKTRKGPSAEVREEEWETTESSASETETESAWPEGLILKVSKRAYDIWEQMLGAENSEVAWVDFLMAMRQAGFQSEKGSGSRWKFHPRGPLRHMGTIVFHEPHPASALRVFQVHKIEARLKRRFSLYIDRFQLDTSRREETTGSL